MWTEEQLEAINKEGTNVIVSAGAGSGKTAVLTERVLRKLNGGVDIDKLLILTFTKAAAKEMKDRIREKIKQNDKLSEQLKIIDKAYITTFDSFALSIVKKYHYILGISKNISIEQGGLVDIKKIKLLDEIFENLYDENNSKFIKFIYDFCLKDDKDLKKMILSINDKLDLKYDKIDYLNKYVENNFNENKINNDINIYINLIKEKINNVNLKLNKINDYVENDYYLKLEDDLLPLINSNTYEEIKNNCNIKLPIIPRNSCEEAKTLKDDITKLIKDIFLLCDYENIEEMNNLIYKTKSYIEVIIDILIKLENKITEYKEINELYTFNDIAKKAIYLLKNNDDVRNTLKNNFNEIMVDEYQDTSDIQETFINLIENNNVYMVGDIKQSIYRFRNANPYIFKNKYDNYKNNNNGYKIDLKKNFRSRTEVLNNINEIFDLIMDDNLGGADYKVDHQMVFGNKNYINDGNNNLNNNLEIYNYEYEYGSKFSKEEIEIFIVANDIKNKIKNNYQVMDKKTNKLRNINYSDFVILMDKSKSFNLYKKVFEYLHIPLTIYKDESMINNINIPIVKNIIRLSILEKNKTYDEEYISLFMSIARSYLFEYDDDFIFDCIRNKNYSTDLISKIKIIVDGLNNNISGIIDNIINVFEIIPNMIKIGNIDENIIVLDYLKEVALNLEDIGYDISQFDEYLTELIENKIELKFSLNKESNNSVKIMTIHGSKGLEYSICYYSGLYSKFNIRELNEKILYKDNFVIPVVNEGYRNTIYSYLLKDNYMKEEISERIRLFYVALTRSREKMIIITSLKENNLLDDKIKFRSFKDIIDSLKDVLDKYIININIEDLHLSKDYNFILKKEIENVKTDILEVNEINVQNELVEDKHFSKNKINYLTKEESNKLKLGTEIHYILEMIDFKNPDLDALDISDFYKNKVAKFLNSDLFKNNIINIYKEFEFEYQDDNLYHGVIDLIIETDDKIMIVDYKLKNTTDEDYNKQLNGYKKYISTLSDKKIEIYLYSIIDETITQL